MMVVRLTAHSGNPMHEPHYGHSLRLLPQAMAGVCSGAAVVRCGINRGLTIPRRLAGRMMSCAAWQQVLLAVPGSCVPPAQVPVLYACGHHGPAV